MKPLRNAGGLVVEGLVIRRPRETESAKLGSFGRHDHYRFGNNCLMNDVRFIQELDGIRDLSHQGNPFERLDLLQTQFNPWRKRDELIVRSNFATNGFLTGSLASR